jgi:hypothetical protein
MTTFLDCGLRQRSGVSNTRWVVHHMTSIRIALASLIAAGALLAGGALAQHAAGAASVSRTVVVAGVGPCCGDEVSTS